MGEKMIKNVDGTSITTNVEKTGFCDVGCRAFGGVLHFNYSGESAVESEYTVT